MDLVSIIFIIVGLVLVGMEALKFSTARISYGWAGLLLIGIALLVRITVAPK